MFYLLHVLRNIRHRERSIALNETGITATTKAQGGDVARFVF
jgi:hypothetical protein